jgi:hypothetical protein
MVAQTAIAHKPVKPFGSRFVFGWPAGQGDSKSPPARELCLLAGYATMAGETG